MTTPLNTPADIRNALAALLAADIDDVTLICELQVINDRAEMML